MSRGDFGSLLLMFDPRIMSKLILNPGGWNQKQNTPYRNLHSKRFVKVLVIHKLTYLRLELTRNASVLFLGLETQGRKQLMLLL